MAKAKKTGKKKAKVRVPASGKKDPGKGTGGGSSGQNGSGDTPL